MSTSAKQHAVARRDLESKARSTAERSAPRTAEQAVESEGFPPGFDLANIDLRGGEADDPLDHTRATAIRMTTGAVTREDTGVLLDQSTRLQDAFVIGGPRTRAAAAAALLAIHRTLQLRAAQRGGRDQDGVLVRPNVLGDAVPWTDQKPRAVHDLPVFSPDNVDAWDAVLSGRRSSALGGAAAPPPTEAEPAAQPRALRPEASPERPPPGPAPDGSAAASAAGPATSRVVKLLSGKTQPFTPAEAAADYNPQGEIGQGLGLLERTRLSSLTAAVLRHHAPKARDVTKQAGERTADSAVGVVFYITPRFVYVLDRSGRIVEGQFYFPLAWITLAPGTYFGGFFQVGRQGGKNPAAPGQLVRLDAEGGPTVVDGSFDVEGPRNELSSRERLYAALKRGGGVGIIVSRAVAASTDTKPEKGLEARAREATDNLVIAIGEARRHVRSALAIAWANIKEKPGEAVMQQVQAFVLGFLTKLTPIAGQLMVAQMVADLLGPTVQIAASASTPEELDLAAQGIARAAVELVLTLPAFAIGHRAGPKVALKKAAAPEVASTLEDASPLDAVRAVMDAAADAKGEPPPGGEPATKAPGGAPQEGRSAAAQPAEKGAPEPAVMPAEQVLKAAEAEGFEGPAPKLEPPAPERVDLARKRLESPERYGKPTVEDVHALLAELVHRVRGSLIKAVGDTYKGVDARELAALMVRGFCNVVPSLVLLELGKMKIAGVRTWYHQAAFLFPGSGTMRHAFLVVEIAGRVFVVDPSIRQFFVAVKDIAPDGNMNALKIAKGDLVTQSRHGAVLRSTAEGARGADAFIRDGFFDITEDGAANAFGEMLTGGRKKTGGYTKGDFTKESSSRHEVDVDPFDDSPVDQMDGTPLDVAGPGKAPAAAVEPTNPALARTDAGKPLAAAAEPTNPALASTDPGKPLAAAAEPTNPALASTDPGRAPSRAGPGETRTGSAAHRSPAVAEVEGLLAELKASADRQLGATPAKRARSLQAMEKGAKTPQELPPSYTELASDWAKVLHLESKLPSFDVEARSNEMALFGMSKAFRNLVFDRLQVRVIIDQVLAEQRAAGDAWRIPAERQAALATQLERTAAALKNNAAAKTPWEGAARHYPFWERMEAYLQILDVPAAEQRTARLWLRVIAERDAGMARRSGAPGGSALPIELMEVAGVPAPLRELIGTLWLLGATGKLSVNPG